jgi:phosphoribosylaminoimidazolecarboxamide formyltransferase/IMP cyclohydrolase
MSDFTIHQALFSVSDKSELLTLASVLSTNTTLLASGGTAYYLRQANLAVTDIADYTQAPEILGGRVKTLHPRIHGGILGRRGQDNQEMMQHGIKGIDLVVVNLYPFTETVKLQKEFSEIIENIDIGGSTLLRAAAKNFQDVLVLCDPRDYDEAIHRIKNNQVDLPFRQQMAAKAFAYSANYEAAIANYFVTLTSEKDQLPTQIFFCLKQSKSLRYGENPQQAAAFYQDNFLQGQAQENHIVSSSQGKELSYNNYLDSDVALRLIQMFIRPSAVIVKHASPCAVASADNLLTACQRAFAADSVSAFGSIVALNAEVDQEIANWFINNGFWEVIIAPHFSEEALKIFSRKKNLRLLLSPKTFNNALELRSVFGGVLVQHADTFNSACDWQTVSQVTVSEKLFDDLRFAWQVCRFAKSNAIVYARHQQTLGIGNGQTSRIDSAFCAARKAEEAGFRLEGAVMASDAFFPFADSVEIAAKLGISAIIQPGGSIRDAEVIAAADKHGIALIFTGRRHFRH